MRFRSNRCIAVHVKDLKKAEKFYRDVLGFKLLSKSRGMLEFETGRLLLYVNKDKKPHPPIPSFDVKSLKDAKAHLEKAGCSIVRESRRAAYFRDPFGLVYGIIEPTR
jgi:catechol 2,3-dioxygenase-like lactoylglutathione lyase family enzyme